MKAHTVFYATPVCGKKTTQHTRPTLGTRKNIMTHMYTRWENKAFLFIIEGAKG